jgi:hypothetical protein
MSLENFSAISYGLRRIIIVIIVVMSLDVTLVS